MALGRNRAFRQWHVYHLNLTPPGASSAVAPLVVVLSSANSNRVHARAVVSEVLPRTPGDIGPTRVELGSAELGMEREGMIDTADLITVPEGTLVEETGRLSTESVARARAALNLTFEQDAWRDTL